jgi:hypothetical protein
MMILIFCKQPKLFNFLHIHKITYIKLFIKYLYILFHTIIDKLYI